MKKEQIEELSKVIKLENEKRGVVDFISSQVVKMPDEKESVKETYNRMFTNEQWFQDHLDHMSRIYINVAEREVFSCTEKWKRIKIFVKKCIRKMLRWYINPVCEQQSEFNETCFYALREVHIILNNLLDHYSDGNKVEENDLKIASIQESQQVLLKALEQYHKSMECRSIVNDETKKYVEMLLSTIENNRTYIEKLETRVQKLEERLNEVR